MRGKQCRALTSDNMSRCLLPLCLNSESYLNVTDQAIGYPDAWPGVALGVSVKIFLVEANI